MTLYLETSMRAQTFNQLLNNVIITNDDALIPLEAIQETDGAPCYQTLSRWIATGLLPKAIVVRRKRYIRKAAWRELLLRQED